MGSGHEALVEDLAVSRQTPFYNVPLGSVWKTCQFADVVEVKKSFDHFSLSIFEVKASRADFLADLRAEKWRGYLDCCHRLYFAAPAGLVRREEIPSEAGLIVKGTKGWVFHKSAPKRDVEVPTEALLALIFLKARKTRRGRSLEALQDALNKFHTRNIKDYRMTTEQLLARKFGKQIAEAWRASDQLEQKRQVYEALIRDVKYHIAQGLGLDESEIDTANWKLSRLCWQIEKRAKELAAIDKGATR